MNESLASALRDSLGAWPPTAPVTLATSSARETPGWDGVVRPFSAVRTPRGTVVSVPAAQLEAARELVTDEESLDVGLRKLGLVREKSSPWTMRWITNAHELAELEPLGEWLAPSHPALPEWVAPFPGRVLAALEDDGSFLGVVALKPCGSTAAEIAVGTDERARARGIARRLVATAARELLGSGKAVMYVHAPDNVASARVADAVGILDRGWQLLGADDAEPS